MEPELPVEATPALQRSQEDTPLTEQPCRNCGDPTSGSYCRSCGQRKAEHRASVRRLLADALQDQFSLTSELPRTFKALAFRPGFLTLEYNRGRIASYIPPFRVYLFTSIVFFLLLSLEASGRNPLGSSDNSSRVRVTVDTTESRVAGSDTDQMINTPFEGLNARLDAKGKQLAKNPEAFREGMKEFMVSRAPTMMFLLLPVFALIMKVFYWRAGRYYAEHFIFALHTHAFAFMIFTLLVLLPETGFLDAAGKLVFCWLALYPLIAMRKVYAQGWIITLLKYATVGLLYLIVFGFAMYVQTIIAILML